ncbi:hypothetical protein ACIQYW_16125 [Rhodococcus erythropolis]|jgi:hypothetical protein|uniref:hypothetical protein n=1 Tax=Rhodococcus baikonurensis TaxID=172041 RepID=UPI0026092181|nr:hypothetical protein [uncultured Rhodococcus sp.]
MSEKCKNCGFTIVRINYALGEKWMHTLPGGRYDMAPGSMYEPYEVCRARTVAEPSEESL